MAQMQTDSAALSAAASEFDSISAELKAAIDAVNHAGEGELSSAMTGSAGTAAQQAFAAFREKGNVQIKLLDDISQNINTSGVQYQSAAEDSAGSIASAMQI